MEHFIVSARKYRPTTFESVVGQQAITNTLENAIANNHLAQALLFTGPRGVGKTTCARILAKRINSDENTSKDEDFAFNIFELDAASNNSVDDIRNLIDQVRIPPQVGKFKVYIIDEVHMLSAAAFNAFLKTLEEPPKHAIFILATTEKHKIIPTILSRCQIFDFRRITVGDIKNHLAHVAKQEGITADENGLHIIAQKADGALRDALSIFDRVVSFSGANLTREAVTQNLNVLDYTTYFEITDLILKGEIPGLLVRYNDILSQGFDGHHFIAGLASHFRDILVCHNTETINLLEVGEQIKEQYLQQSKKASKAFLINAIELANSCDLKYKTSRNQRLLVELCLMQLASITADGEKKNNERYLIPASHFKNQSPPERVDIPVVAPAAIKAPAKEVLAEKEPEKIEPPIQEEIKTATPEQTIESEPLTSQPASTEELEQKKIAIAKRNAQRVSGLSLKSIQQKQALKRELAAKSVTHEELPTEDFTQNDFVTSWKHYTQKMADNGKYNLVSHLTMATPKVDGNIVHLEYPNSTIKVEVESAQYELLKFLRSDLNNHEIQLDITVNEAAQKKYVYTAQEKFEKLKEMNPIIDKLRKDFDLDV
ncbi:MAG: DNA polymerase III subunit gamma/tau [Gilvibacter sp.]